MPKKVSHVKIKELKTDFAVIKNLAKVVITGKVGPSVFEVLSTAGIRIVTDVSGTVKEAVERYKRDEFKEISRPTVGGHFGIGGRHGRGR